ncbi:myosin heavy chain, non-muscle-like isoform X2 [Paralichthys olivaceus]|uniref:myosin heavy chain, non-muscle-like isoform X2 n=1 Tax=Paralichthys olivaceus TaxID=8255 RepID=UPI0037538680
MDTSPSYCPQDTKKNIEEKSMQETDYPSDFEDTDSELSDSELSTEEEIEEEFEGEIEEELEEEIEEELEGEIEEELEGGVQEKLEEEIEEELEEEIEEELEEEIEEELEGEIEEELEGEIEEELEEIEKETLQDIDSLSDADELRKSELSWEADLQKAILRESGARTAHKVNVNSVKRDRAQMEEDLKKERIEKDALNFMQEKAESNIIRAKLDYMKAQMADLRRSGENDQDHQLASENKRQGSNLEDSLHKGQFAQKDQATGTLEATEAKSKETLPQKDDNIFKSQATFALNQPQKNADKLDNLIHENQQLASENKRLQSKLEDAVREMQGAREAAISQQCKLDHLTNRNHQLAYEKNRVQDELKDVRTNMCLAREAATNQHKEDRAELDNLMSQNDQVASENKRLQGELKDAVREMQGAREAAISQECKLDHLTKVNQQLACENKRVLEDAARQHQEDREACSRLEVQVKKENARFLRVKEQLERLKKAPADTEGLLYDKNTQRLLNKDIMGTLEETVSQKIKDADKLNHLTYDNHQLASDNKRPQSEQEDAVQQQKEGREACSRLEEQAKKEKPQFLRACKKLKMLKKAPVSVETLLYDMETLKMDNKYITGKLEALEVQLVVQREKGLAQQHEVLAEKDDIILKTQAINAKLKNKVNELREQLSESKVRQVQLENALNQEKIQKAVLEERGNNTASTLEKEKRRINRFANALKKERAANERYSVELMEAKINQVKLQERQHLSPFLHTAQSHLCRPQQRSNFSSRNNSDIVLKMDETSNALDNLQKIQRDLFSSFHKILELPTSTQTAGAAVDGPEVH